MEGVLSSVAARREQPRDPDGGQGTQTVCAREDLGLAHPVFIPRCMIARMTAFPCILHQRLQLRTDGHQCGACCGRHAKKCLSNPIYVFATQQTYPEHGPHEFHRRVRHQHRGVLLFEREVTLLDAKLQQGTTPVFCFRIANNTCILA